MEAAGIPYQMDNTFGDDEIARAQAVNSLMDNFNFSSTLFQSGIPAEDASILYHLGAIQTYHDENGKKWVVNEPGMTGNYERENYNSDILAMISKSASELNEYNYNNTYPMYPPEIIETLYKWESKNEYFNFF